MKLLLKKGTTSYSAYVYLTRTDTGGPLTGVVFNSAGLTAYYVRNRGLATAITLATLAAADSAWSSGGFKEVSATNMPGWYRLDVPDAVLATGVSQAGVHLKGASNMQDLPLEVQLVTFDPDSSTLGMTLATANEIADAYMDRSNAIETGLTPRGFMRGAAAALFGKASGMATSTGVFRNAVQDSKARITATQDADGNRTAITTDLV